MTAVACRGGESGEGGESSAGGGDGPPPVPTMEVPSYPKGPDRPALPPGWRVIYHDTVDLAVSADGQWLAGGDLAGTALLYDMSDGHFAWGDKTQVGVTPHVAMAGSGARFFAGQEGGDEAPLRVLDVAARKRTAALGVATRGIHDVATDAAGVRVATLTAAGEAPTVDEALHVYELGPSGTGSEVFAPPTKLARGKVALSADGAWVAVASTDGRLTAWKVGEATPVLTWKQLEPLRHIAFGGESGRVWVADERTITSFVLAAGTPAPAPGTPPAPVPAPAPGTPPAPVPATPTPAPTPVAAMPASSAKTAGDALRGLVALSDGRVLGIGHASGEGGGLSVYDGLTGAPAGRAASGCRCERNAISANGKLAVCMCADATEIRWGPLVLGASANKP